MTYSNLAILLSLTNLSLGRSGDYYSGDYYSNRIAQSARVWGVPHRRDYPIVGLPRGGSTSTTADPSSASPYQSEPWSEPAPPSSLDSTSYYHHTLHSKQHQPFKPPKISLERISLALRLTGEWNRRLVDGVTGRAKHVDDDLSSSRHQQILHNQPLRGGSHPVNVHPSRSWHPPIKGEETETYQEELTVFHAKAPREPEQTQPLGASRWGPELLPYLEDLVTRLGIDRNEENIEVALAMIYLDRACSVETPRSSDVPPCPFCTPRTVHRLSLAALLIATQTVRGGTLDQYYEKLQSLGVSLVELEQMVHWMTSALGDAGVLVTVEQMMDWSQTWDAIFSPKSKV